MIGHHPNTCASNWKSERPTTATSPRPRLPPQLDTSGAASHSSAYRYRLTRRRAWRRRRRSGHCASTLQHKGYSVASFRTPLAHLRVLNRDRFCADANQHDVDPASDFRAGFREERGFVSKVRQKTPGTDDLLSAPHGARLWNLFHNCDPLYYW